MRQFWLVWVSLCVCLSIVGINDSLAQTQTYSVITADNAIALEQIGIMGGDQGRIAVSTDNHWMAIGGLQGVWLVDLDAGDEGARLLTGHTDKVNAVEFHPTNSNILASTGDDGTIRLWDVIEEENNRVINAQDSPIFGINFDSTATFIASAGGASVRIFDVETGEQVKELTDVPQGVHRVEFLHDSPLLLAGTFNSSLAVWNLNDETFVGEITNGFNGDVRAIATSANGEQMAIGLFSGRVILSTISTGAQLTLDYQGGGVTDVAFSPDGNMLASVGMDNKVLITETTHGDLITEFELADFTYSIAFSNDNQRVYVASNDGKVTTWDIERGQMVEDRILAFPTVRQVVYSPNGRFIAAVADDDSLGHVFNAQTHKQIAVLNGHEGRIFSIAYRSDSRLIATAGIGGDVLIWDTNTFELADTLSTNEDRIYSVAFSPNPNVLAVGGESFIRLWHLRNKQELLALDNGKTVWGLAFSPDGSLIAAPSGLWDAFERTKLDVNIGEFVAIAMSPNSDLLATTEKFIPIEPNRVRPAWQGFVGANNTKIGFSPDGTLVAMAINNSIQIIDVETQLVIATLDGHNSNISSLAFSPDGTKIVSGGLDATIRQWAIVGDVPEDNDKTTISMDGLVLDIIPTDSPSPTVTETTLTADTIEQVETTIVRQAISNVVDIDVAPGGSSAILATLQGVFYIDLTNLTIPPIAMLPTDEKIFTSGLAVDYALDGTMAVVSHGFARSQETIGGGITVWDLSNGLPELTDEFVISGDRGFSIALSTNKAFVAVGFDNPKAQIININSGPIISETQDAVFARVNGLSFSPDDATLTLSDTNGNKAFFRTATGEFLGGFNSGIAVPMWWSPDKTYLYSAEQTGFILRDGSNTEPIRENPYPESLIGDIKTTDVTNGQLVIASDDIIWFLDYLTGETTQTITGFESIITTAEVTTDGQQLIAVTNDNKLRVWDIQSGQQLSEHELGFIDPQADIAISDDGRYFAIGNKDEVIRIFSAESGEFSRNIETEQTKQLVFLPNSTILAATRFDNTIEFWNVPTGRLLDTVNTDHTQLVTISQNGDYMVTRNDNKQLTLQNIRTGEILFDDVQVHLTEFNDVDISTTENLMATAGDDGVVKLWDLDSREQKALIWAHDNGVERVAFAPHEPLLATIGADGVHVYDYRPFYSIDVDYVFSLPVTSVNGLYFSVDGSLLLAHVADTLHVWSMDNGREVAILSLPDTVSILTADGNRIIAADEEGTIYSLAVVDAIEN
jgi:WD40 repeat protein